MSAITRAILAAAIAAGLAGPALAADLAQPVEEPVYKEPVTDQRIPNCLNASVQRAVTRRVARAYPGYYDGRKIANLDGVVETAYQIDNPSPLARRYCEGHATLSDGNIHRVYFKVVERQGFVGVSWGVEACLDGLDRWRVYDGYCRTVRPQ
ncbi:cytoplasmic protein [Stappia sp. GBMRC 2046]|uniref:Cytoplasmic protein n=1 Tax=Stappia sediminis TaxID=2692190 RepID=A0A7X3S5Q7_9HYPH|nr:cytoplasmic protein [Stappia sediminis]MXN63390.1 cytoplasmic protein [Stappia sediminis]